MPLRPTRAVGLNGHPQQRLASVSCVVCTTCYDGPRAAHPHGAGGQTTGRCAVFGSAGGRTRHCQVADERAFFSLGAEAPESRSAGTRNLIPLTERTGPQETVVSCPEQVTSDPEEILDDAVHRGEPLQMGGRT